MLGETAETALKMFRPPNKIVLIVETHRCIQGIEFVVEEKPKSFCFATVFDAV